MALKQYVLTDDITVTVYKRRLSRSIRLSIAANGEVRVSIPTWVAFKAGEMFARSRLDWIREQRITPGVLQPGQAIGKDHNLIFKVSVKNVKCTTRVKAGSIIVTHPLSLPFTAAEVQTAASKAAVRALRTEAEAVLPGRLRVLAKQNGFTFKSVSIKQLTSRWGSCDQQKNIALNLYLMQLPWSLIDYVLLHELVHTRHLNHGDDFWSALESVAPGAKRLRSEIKKHKPVVLG